MKSLFQHQHDQRYIYVQSFEAIILYSFTWLWHNDITEFGLSPQDCLPTSGIGEPGTVYPLLVHNCNGSLLRKRKV